MSLRTYEEKRLTQRHRLGRLASMIPADGGPPRFCLVTDFSDGGVRVNANGLKIPDEFVLQFSGDGQFKDGTYKVVWRNDPIVGAKFIKRLSPGA
ncbi:MAG: PilZ domain-containing protein [Xanthobacteraceae bacterium]